MKFSFYTLGCKVNQYETNALKEIVLNKGYEITSQTPDIFVINTCTVTAVSDKKNLKLVRKIKKENPNSIIAVCGCFAQISPEKLDVNEVDIICGTDKRADVIDMCIDSYKTKNKYKVSQNTSQTNAFEVLPASVNNGRTRGLIKIQDGCNNFCTYCIIPYARGRNRSMQFDEVLNQIETLNQSNILEITITGIEIASYGVDIGENLVNLLDTICRKYPHIRFRLGSLEPRVVTEAFCKFLSIHDNLCPHFHLSMQSGSDTVLKRMNRKYDTALYYNSCEKLRKYFKNPAITTDLIVGFPGETDDEFNQTLEFIQKCNFANMHIFPYSIREGTKASTMDDQIDINIKNVRSKIATNISKEMEKKYLESFVNNKLEVIFEEPKDDFISGHTKYNFQIAVKSNNFIQGEKADILIKKVENLIVFGEN